MKYTYLFLLFSLIWNTNSLWAQSTTSNTERPEETFYNMPNTHSFHIGAGFPNKISTVLSGIEILGLAQEDGYATPQFTLRYEYGLTEGLGIGLHTGYYQARTPTLQVPEVIGGFLCDLLDDIDLDNLPLGCEVVNETIEPTTFRAFSVAGRLAYYKQTLPKLATYGSVVAGYSFLSGDGVSNLLNDLGGLGVDIPTFVYYGGAGVRYFISPNWGIYGEIGYGSVTYANVGLTYRIL